MTEPQQRLAAICFADIVGYSELAATDESRAVRLIELFQSVATKCVEAAGGRVIKFMGDGMLAELPSVQAAVTTGIELQTKFADRTRVDMDDCFPLRVGVHIGDVIVKEDGDLYGDGVNLAARLHEVADPGQLVVSQDVYLQIHRRDEFECVDLGAHELKGVVDAVRLYGVQAPAAGDGESRQRRVGRQSQSKRSARRRNLAYIGVGFLLAAATLGAWMLIGREEEQQTLRGVQEQLQALEARQAEQRAAGEVQDPEVTAELQRLRALVEEMREEEGRPARRPARDPDPAPDTIDTSPDDLIPGSGAEVLPSCGEARPRMADSRGTT